MDIDIIDYYVKKHPDIKYRICDSDNPSDKGYYCSLNRLVKIFIGNIEDEEELERTLKHETLHIKLLDSFKVRFQGIIILKRLLNAFEIHYPNQVEQIKSFYPNINMINLACECMAFYVEDHDLYKPKIKDRFDYYKVYTLSKKELSVEDIRNIANILIWK